MSAIQMNVRVEPALKRAGDFVVSQRGYTPSQVVRALWEYMAIHQTLPTEVEHEILQSRMGQAPSTSAPIVFPDEGAHLVSEFYARVGVPEPDGPVPLDYSELHERAALEQLGDWGLV